LWHTTTLAAASVSLAAACCSSICVSGHHVSINRGVHALAVLMAQQWHSTNTVLVQMLHSSAVQDMHSSVMGI
jgi:hypothetical protein